MFRTNVEMRIDERNSRIILLVQLVVTTEQ